MGPPDFGWNEAKPSPFKGQTKSKQFFQAVVSSKKWTNEFYFTTMKPQVDMFSFVFWRKLKTPKIRFEINWRPQITTVLPTEFSGISTIYGDKKSHQRQLLDIWSFLHTKIIPENISLKKNQILLKYWHIICNTWRLVSH